MELILAASAGLIFLSILLSPLAVRTGAPLLLFFLLIGMLLGEDGPGGIDFDDFELAYQLGSVALAIILFSGGLDTKMDDVRKAWLPAVLLATIGVCLTVGLTGGALMLLLGIPLWNALLLGAVVGSTDAAATFMLLQQRGVQLKGRNKETILLESGLNDPVAIFLTLLVLGIVDHGSESLGWSTLGVLVSQLGLGAVLGIGGGVALAWIVNRVTLPVGLYSVLVLSGGLLLFGLTASLGGSGFLAVYLAGIVVRDQVARTLERIVNYHEAMAWLSQIGLFLMLGLLVTPRDLPVDAFLGLNKDTPNKRPVTPQSSATAAVVALPRVGRLHQRYEWREAARASRRRMSPPQISEPRRAWTDATVGKWVVDHPTLSLRVP